jgi:peptide/nickel transport system permease protein
MQRFIVNRVAWALVAIFAVSVIVFGLARITGSPIDTILPDDATEEDLEQARRAWGLDQPLHRQYLIFVGNALHGNFGDSIRWSGKTAGAMVLSRIPATLQLAGFALAVSIFLALPIGVISAVNKDSPVDYAGKIMALLGQSIPTFWLGIVLMWVFAVYLGWLPTSGRGGFQHMILPAIALGWYQVAALMRLTRSSMLEVLDSEYIKLARIKGVAEWKVIWKHCLRNAAATPVTYFGLILGSFLAGSVAIETVFAWPGIGQLAIDAIRSRDFPVVQTVVLFFAVVYIVSNLLVDILYAYLDPRIRNAMA